MSEFENCASGLDSPPSRVFPISPSQTSVLNVPTRGLMVAQPGDVAVETISGDIATLPALLPGVQYAVRARRVLSVGTTATGIVGLA